MYSAVYVVLYENGGELEIMVCLLDGTKWVQNKAFLYPSGSYTIFSLLMVIKEKHYRAFQTSPCTKAMAMEGYNIRYKAINRTDTHSFHCCLGVTWHSSVYELLLST